jgi:hypothetical protein
MVARDGIEPPTRGFSGQPPEVSGRGCLPEPRLLRALGSFDHGLIWGTLSPYTRCSSS